MHQPPMHSEDSSTRHFPLQRAEWTPDKARNRLLPIAVTKYRRTPIEPQPTQATGRLLNIRPDVTFQPVGGSLSRSHIFGGHTHPPWLWSLQADTLTSGSMALMSVLARATSKSYIR